uniref:Uncharacterized protein n=1 Tax=Manihot esculenta TaxID=3983 RepID=A0A2C9VN04_MANES
MYNFPIMGKTVKPLYKKNKIKLNWQGMLKRNYFHHNHGIKEGLATM